jgi:ethanolaminephosphotransferase
MIDALRHDFIFKDKSMFHVDKLIEENKGVPFILKVQTPTVTLPRLKATLSGTNPEFIDILWNFNTTRIENDNILEQFKMDNKKIVFYGDDTWLKLFPANDFFLRNEGVTSFIASDFDEVDKNVTRHLENELSRNDWQVMVLHYLGLDHIGHIEGPNSDRMKKKLTEMDDIFMDIYENITENVSGSLKTILFLEIFYFFYIG